MCGICGLIGRSDEQILARMLSAMRYRGPDGSEVRAFGSHCVAANRLAIFGDPEASPVYEDTHARRVVLLNGEIYNYQDLWNYLIREGISPPRTGLEAELISALYARYGTAFPEMLKGMFALAIVEESGLLLVRDRLGVKPLYYSQQESCLAFASEIKALLQCPGVSRALNHRALEETRVFGYVLSTGETLFENILQVPPGSFLRFDGKGAVMERKTYFTPTPARYLRPGPIPDYRATVAQTRQILINAAEAMTAHGSEEKAVFLSGGLDSSIMALILSAHLGQDVLTYTLADSPSTPDRDSARRVASKLGTRHTDLAVTLQDYWRALPLYVAHYEGLMAGGVFHIQGGVAFHLLVERFSQNARIAFTGEGADELFGGYYWVYTHPLGFADRIRQNLAALPRDNRVRDVVESLFPQPESEDVYRRNLFDFLLGSGLSNYHLQSVDRSGGAFGVELRPLYLDDDLTGWATNLAIEYKVPDNRTTKRILRDAFREDFVALGLEEVLTRQKMGMPSALEKLEDAIQAAVNRVIHEEELARHPLGALLGSKMGLLLCDTFEQVFLYDWDPHESDPPADSLLARLWPGSLL